MKIKYSACGIEKNIITFPGDRIRGYCDRLGRIHLSDKCFSEASTNLADSLFLHEVGHARSRKVIVPAFLFSMAVTILYFVLMTPFVFLVFRWTDEYHADLYAQRKMGKGNWDSAMKELYEKNKPSWDYLITHLR